MRNTIESYCRVHEYGLHGQTGGVLIWHYSVIVQGAGLLRGATNSLYNIESHRLSFLPSSFLPSFLPSFLLSFLLFCFLRFRRFVSFVVVAEKVTKMKNGKCTSEIAVVYSMGID